MKTIKGKVIRGEGIGRVLGYPTANIEYQKDVAGGLYACWVRVEGDRSVRQGVAIIGMLPRHSEIGKKTEVHIIDFDRVIYGARIEAQLVKKLRELIVFDSEEELIRQIERDIEETKRLLGEVSGV